MNEPTCGTCVHFRRHYILFDVDRYEPIPCGHYVFPRIKHRRTDTAACVHYRQIPEKETAGDRLPGDRSTIFI